MAGHATATGARSSTSSSAVRATARRRRRVYPGEPPATVAIPLDEAALGQSAQPHGDGRSCRSGLLSPIADASLWIVAHSL